jgi:hypothetical protein
MYRLYVDEVGTDNLVHLEKDKHRYLSLTGVALKIADARDHLAPTMNRIKARIFDHFPAYLPPQRDHGPQGRVSVPERRCDMKDIRRRNSANDPRDRVHGHQP